LAEDRGVDLRLGRIFQALDLFFRLGRDVGFERLNIIFHAGGYTLDQPDFPVLARRTARRTAIRSVRIVFVSHMIPLEYLVIPSALFLARGICSTR